MTVRGKFFVIGLEKSCPQGAEKDYKKYSAGTTIKLGAVSASDNEKSENSMFHKYTPSGSISMFVDNPSAEAFFELGKVIYVDFSEAPAE